MVPDSAAPPDDPCHRPLLVMRGRFSHPELFDPGLFQAAHQQLLADGTPFEREPATLLEVTIHHASCDETLAAPEMLPGQPT